MFKFMVLMKEAVNNDSKVFKRDLIGVIWTLMAREIKLTDERHRLNTSDQNPFIPKLLEKLYSYNPQRSLSRLEYLQLF